jgi:hypothetical protein
MQKPSNKTIGWAILVIVVVALQVFLGVRYPLPSPPSIPPEWGEEWEGVSLGTTHLSELDVNGAINYGTNNLYPVGHASEGQQIVYGTSTITGTAIANHGLTTVTFCAATLGEDPTAGAGDAAHVSVSVSSNVCTLKAWQDDLVTAATETDVDVHWIVVGAP